MEIAPSGPSSESPKPNKYTSLRIWPAVLLLAAMAITRALPSLLENGPSTLWMSAAFGPAICGILLMLWWLIASRAIWQERVFGVLGLLILAGLAIGLSDRSMAGPATLMLTIPAGMAAFSVGAMLFSKTLSRKRTVFAVLIAACGFSTSLFFRSDGLWGDNRLGLQPRWQDSSEELLIAYKAREGKPSSAIQPSYFGRLADPEWPGFRGADRQSRQRGSQIRSDWAKSPPVELWRIPVGPGWSSFAIAGELAFTQEQRGPMETTVCYGTGSGNELWTHDVESRFEDPLGGPGPRATPTIAESDLFVMGATGTLCRLDARSGREIWKANLCDLADRSPPMWGFSSSPLIVDSKVIVHAGGDGEKGVMAFDIATGELAWSSSCGEQCYGSPQLCNILDVPYVVLLSDVGMQIYEPSTGKERLTYDWPHKGYRALQPQIIDGNSVLIPTGMGTGTRRARLTNADGVLAAEEEWTSLQLKPDFNDFVVHQGHAYGFDNSIFVSIDLATGERNWKGGRYGKGQVLLLADGGLLIVATEKGDIVLLKATASEHSELATLKALSGKTWNHPVVVGNRLYARNSAEAVCYRLPVRE